MIAISDVWVPTPAQPALILDTNEYAKSNPTHPDIILSDWWKVTSGSLFNYGGSYYTGALDSVSPNYNSSNGTNSNVFRAISKVVMGQSNYSIAMNALVNQMGYPGTANPQTDGIHLMLRYVDENNIYYVSCFRRDGTVVIKKKKAGVYYSMSAALPVPIFQDRWARYEAKVVTNADGSVSLSLLINDALAVAATDNGSSYGGAVLAGPGKVGVRGDWCRFLFSQLRVTSL